MMFSKCARAHVARALATLAFAGAVASNAYAQAGDPLSPDTQALRYMAQVDESIGKLKQSCGWALAAGGASKTVIDLLLGAVKDVASRASLAATVVVGLGLSGVCYQEFVQQRAKLRGAWYAINAGNRTLEAKISVLRYLAVESFMLELMMDQLPELLSDPLKPEGNDRTTLRDLAVDLRAAMLACLQASDPNASAACAFVLGNDSPAASRLRLGLAKSHALEKCLEQNWPTASEHPEYAVQAALSMCLDRVERAAASNTLRAVSINQREFANPFASNSSDVWEKRLAITNPAAQVSVIRDLISRFALGDFSLDDRRIYYFPASGSPVQLLTTSPNTVAFAGYNFRVSFSVDYATTNLNLFKKPTGGVIEINGQKFDFAFQYDNTGNLKADGQGGWLFTLRAPDGSLYEGSSGGGSGRRPALRKLRYAASDVSLFRISFDDAGRAVVNYGEFLATAAAAGADAVSILGVQYALERNAAGQVVGLRIPTPMGVEYYPVGADGRVASSALGGGARRILGQLITHKGERRSIEIVQRGDQTSLRVERDAAGNELRREETFRNGWRNITENGMVTVINDDGATVSTRRWNAETGTTLICSLYGSDGQPRWCSEGERSWNPRDGWDGENPYNAEIGLLERTPWGFREVCVNLSARCSAQVNTVDFFPPPPVPEGSGIVDCWQLVSAFGWEQLRELVRTNPVYAQCPIGYGLRIDSVPDGDLKNSPVRAFGILLTDSDQSHSAHPVADPNDPASGAGAARPCRPILAGRELELWRVTPGTLDAVRLGHACLHAISPYSLDFTLPVDTPQGMYRIALRNLDNPAAAVVSAIVVVEREPEFVVVESARGVQPIPAGEYATAYGSGLAGTTVAMREPPTEVCRTELGGVSVMVAERLACIVYVSPTQINFVMPAELAVGQYRASLFDATRATEWNTLGPETKRSDPFIVAEPTPNVLAPRSVSSRPENRSTPGRVVR